MDLGTACVQLWIGSAEQPGERCYENGNNNNSFILSLDNTLSTPPIRLRDITTVNSDQVIGWLNFHYFICTSNIICWKPDPPPCSPDREVLSLNVMCNIMHYFGKVIVI